MKKFFISLAFLMSFTLILSAKPIISVSIPPQAFFVQKIAGDFADINVIVPPNTDEHNIDFKPATIAKLEKSDIYFTTGLEFEKPMLYKFQSLFKHLEIVDLRKDIKTLYTTFSHSHGDTEHEEHSKENHSHFEHKHAPAIFKDSEVKDRSLSDWQGEFKSVYPLLLDGSLDEVFTLKALNSKQTAKEIKEYYNEGYKGDISKIIISKDEMSFFQNGVKTSGNYAYKGFKIFTYESGKRGVRYQFENVDKASKAPRFVQFSDHQIEPTKVNHFHIYFGNESFDKLNQNMHNWQTFYAASMSKDEIVEDQIAHIELGNDPHIWLDPVLVKTQASTIAQALSAKYPQQRAKFEANLKSFLNELDALNAKITALLKDKAGKKFIVYHPSWGYFAARYHLVQIPIELDGKEPKAKDLKVLVETAKKEKIKTIFVQKGFPQNAARALAKELGAKVLEIDHLSGDWENELLKSAEILSQN